MASQGGTSRLAQMQMRFQQKQQQERERRKIEMIGDIVIGKNKISDDVSIGNNDTKTIITTASTKKTITTTKSNSINSIEKKSLSSSIGPGKVRQMFNERRQRSTGIDKSYPLKPIPPRASTNITGSRTITTTTTTAASAINSTQKQITTNLKQTNNNNSTSSLQKNDILNGNTNNYNNNNGHEQQQDNIDNETFPSDARFNPDNDVLDGPLSSKLPNVGKPKNGIIHDDKNNNRSNSNLKLKPVVTKKTPPIMNAPPSSTNKNNKQYTLPLSSSPVNNTKSTTPTTLSSKTKIESSRTMNTNKNLKDEKNTATTITTSNANNGLSTCRICNRNFNSDRLEKHEKICEKSANKKRKKYDAVKHRVAGTEVEKYVRKSSKIGGTIKSNTNKLTGTTTKLINPTNTNNNNNNNNGNKGSNWRKTHEEFINTIRAAKQMKAHLAKGGKLSDLPPPPPSENLDYIQCPHCSRKFNQGAAERHIPKCANFRHNKPKTGSTPTNAMKKRF